MSVGTGRQMWPIDLVDTSLSSAINFFMLLFLVRRYPPSFDSLTENCRQNGTAKCLWATHKLLAANKVGVHVLQCL